MLGNTWKDKVDGVDVNSADDINQVAHAVIDLENKRTKVTVDSELYVNSENPVQNKVVTAKFNDVDEKIAEIEPRIVNYEADIFDLNEELTNNLIINAGMIINSLNITFNFPKFGDMASLHFSSPETIPTNYTTFPSLVRFKGDSTQDEKFVAEPNMYYTMVFEKLGDRIIGYVSGVTI